MMLQADEVSSEIYTVEATRADITRLAVGCVNRFATSGFLDIPTIQSAEPDAGAVVATNHLAGRGLNGRDVRTKLTVEAREGRFRILNENFAVFSEWKLEWVAIDAAHDRWSQAVARVEVQNEEIAGCIRAADAKDNW